MLTRRLFFFSLFRRRPVDRNAVWNDLGLHFIRMYAGMRDLEKAMVLVVGTPHVTSAAGRKAVRFIRDAEKDFTKELDSLDKLL